MIMPRTRATDHEVSKNRMNPNYHHPNNQDDKDINGSNPFSSADSASSQSQTLAQPSNVETCSLIQNEKLKRFVQPLSRVTSFQARESKADDNVSDDVNEQKGKSLEYFDCNSNSKSEETDSTNLRRKASIAVGGFSLIAAGIPLIPLGPGEFMILGGVALLAQEFPMAQRILDTGKNKLVRFASEDEEKENCGDDIGGNHDKDFGEEKEDNEDDSGDISRNIEGPLASGGNKNEGNTKNISNHVTIEPKGIIDRFQTLHITGKEKIKNSNATKALKKVIREKILPIMDDFSND